MKKTHASIITVLLICVSLTAFGLYGCGKQEPGAPAAGGTAAQKADVAQKAAPEPSQAPITEERTFYDFETADLNGWEVPMWALGKTDYMAKEAKMSTDFASKGKGSMAVVTDFPGGMWAGALVEIQQYLDISRYRVIRADIYLPEDAPIGLKAKLILTVGSNWKFVEQSGSVPLTPGEWSTITANIEPGSFYDWKRIVPDEEFAKDVRKIAIRIESNRKPKYAGTIYIDNVRAGR